MLRFSSKPRGVGIATEESHKLTASHRTCVSDRILRRLSLGALLVALLAACVAHAQWVFGPGMPQPRYAAASAVLEGKLYVIGGLDASDTVQRDVFVYDPLAERWTTDVPPLPAPRCRAACVEFGGKLYVLGGNNGSGSVDTVFAYDPLHNAWSFAGRMAEPREACAAVIWRDNIYVLGGGTARETAREFTYIPQIEIFDTVARRGVQVSIQLPDPPRSNFSAVSFAGQIILIGGLYYGPIDIVDALDSQGRWTRLPPLNTARSSPAVVATEVGILAVGGDGFAGPLRSAEWFPVYTWTSSRQFIDSLRVPRTEAAVGYLQGLVIVAGGRGPNGALASVELLLMGTAVRSFAAGNTPRTFSLKGPYPNPFREKTAVIVEWGPDASSVDVAVYDCLGRRVAEARTNTANSHWRFEWDGTDASGRRVTPGIYFLRVTIGGRSETRKVVYAP